MILDGWGIGKGDKSDVISQVPTPNMDRLEKEYPSSRLHASGENVGLPDGQMGNSEVGHLNIGAGRIVYQDLVKINMAVKDGSIMRIKPWWRHFPMHAITKAGAFHGSAFRWRGAFSG